MAHATFHPHDLELRLGICGGRHRYYCPPDITVTDDELAKLNTLANMAIEQYNSTQGTNYTNVKLIETDTSVAAGTLYFLTFEASLPDDNTFDPQTFDAVVFGNSERKGTREKTEIRGDYAEFFKALEAEKEEERKRRYVEGFK
ncbi:hypothetical protein POM88_027908 [Heracleum sosnowskyi]|uniref:Cystatin domain-containing protein n=1 Tax=Heracleum sosnowskyi TaxID=360622 RepID=A0AAD8I9V6_9APIA|nr:hypothetical protein POM88_027908 [Heracleum sosnowskyi]